MHVCFSEPVLGPSTFYFIISSICFFCLTPPRPVPQAGSEGQFQNIFYLFCFFWLLPGLWPWQAQKGKGKAGAAKAKSEA